MAVPRRLRILQAMETLAQGITVENGCHTDLGEHVLFADLPKFGTDDPQNYLCLLPSEDSPSEQQVGKVRTGLPVGALIIVNPQAHDKGVYRELAIADVKQAFERSPGNEALVRLLQGGTGKPTGVERGPITTFDRAAGSEFYGALLMYTLHYDDSVGHPEA